MKITPTRTMRLAGQRVEAGKTVDVPDGAAELALRHGWATKAAGKSERPPKAAGKSERPPKAEPAPQSSGDE